MMNAQAISRQARLREISSALVIARRSASALPSFPGELPDSFDDAYAIQQLSRESWEDEVAGWKVGGVPPDFIDTFGETHLVGPIFAKSVKYVGPGESVDMPVFARAFGAIEPEFIVQLGETLAHDRLFIGAEIASSPLPAINDIGPIAVISDFGNNNGMIIGPEIVGWREHTVAPTLVACEIDDQQVGACEVRDLVGSVDQAIAFLLSHADRRRIEIPVGTYISTGAITGIHEAEAGASSRISFGDLGDFSLTLIEAPAS
ncbi:2-keto-4-pentenoate hydratase [Erythrobacter sp. W53]|uniref:2-keto-4-pentenoate hydratase n=1 Tax=Erythrobacter sp. W53 TaxID=3425947 RepID=UPI003D7692DA